MQVKCKRTVCEKCDDKNCLNCIAGMLYDAEDERLAKIYQREVNHIRDNFIRKMEHDRVLGRRRQF